MILAMTTIQFSMIMQRFQIPFIILKIVIIFLGGQLTVNSNLSRKIEVPCALLWWKTLPDQRNDHYTAPILLAFSLNL